MFAGPALGVLAPLAVAVGLLAWLLFGAPAVAMALPGSGLVVGLDGVSGYFLLLVLVEQAACARRPGVIAGTVLAMLAGDGMTLLAGVALAGGGRRLPGLPAGLLLAALALLGGGTFDAMRLAAETVPAGALTGLVIAVAVRLASPLGTYLAVRLLLDVASPLPASAGTGLVLAGAALALGCAVTAWRARHLPRLLDALPRCFSGFALMGAGMVLAGTTSDLPAPAAAGLAVLFLASLITAMVLPVWRIVGTIALRQGEGADRGALSGVLRGLPLGGLSALLAGLTLALVPPGAGFAMLWQGFAGVRTLPANPLATAAAALALALTAGLLAQTALRLLAAGFGGVRRGVADEGQMEGALFALFGCTALFAGLFPGLAFMLGAPAAAIVAGTILPAGGQGYLPWAVGALLAGLAAIMVPLLRRRGVEGHRVIAEAAPGFDAARAGPDRLLPRPLRRVLRRAGAIARRAAGWQTAAPTPSAAMAGAFALFVLLLLGQALS